MKLPLPPDVEFHEDIGLLIHRPRGLLNRAAINKIISLIGELEFTLKKPFNRFLDTVAADAVDLNLEYIRRVSLYRRDRKSTRLNSSHRCISYAVFCLKKKKK